MTLVTPRYVRIKLDQAIYDRARQAADADRRSLTNWLVVTVERALTRALPRDQAEAEASADIERRRQELEPPSP